MGPSLGIKVEAYDSESKPVEDGVPGDVVISRSFPNQPVYFFGDPTGEKYFNAYYSKHENVWTVSADIPH